LHEQMLVVLAEGLPSCKDVLHTSVQSPKTDFIKKRTKHLKFVFTPPEHREDSLEIDVACCKSCLLSMMTHRFVRR
jgi:hypothetical protein